MRESFARAHRPTLADVARLAGVSKATASYAFSQPTRLGDASLQRVLAAADELGFRGPSGLGRQLASGRSGVIAVVTAMLTDAKHDDRFSLTVLEGLLRELANLGYGALVIPPASNERNARLLHELAFDGAICVQRRGHLHETDALLDARGVPVLRLDGNSEDDLAMVLGDTEAVATILDGLRASGHDRIATVTLFFDRFAPQSRLRRVDDVAGAKPASVRARLAGFERAGVVPSGVYECAAVSRQEGVAAGRALLTQDPRPTAIVCQADVLAVGVIEAAKELGLRVPDDLSVTGFDALSGPQVGGIDLTSVDHSPLDRGTAAARWVVARAEGRDEPRAVISTKVRWGATTGPVADGVA